MRPTTPGDLTRFSLVLALILVLKWESLRDPPFWDAAMGLFPAAITLAATGFDLSGLLGMPGYLEGGPNAHATSPVTLATAVVFLAAGAGASALLILHLLHFAVAAWALLTLFRLARPIFGMPGTPLFVLSVLLHPTFSAQVGGLYMEVVLFLCAVSALHAWMEQRFWPAVLWGTLAYATKESGIIVPATLALATLIEHRPPRDKVNRVGRILMPSVAWTVGVAVMRRVATAGQESVALVPTLDAVFGGIGQYLERFLLNVPDLLVYFAVFFFVAVASAIPIFRAMSAEPTHPPSRTPEARELLVLGSTGLAIAFFVLLFLVALPVVAGFTVILPRYYVIVLPFLLLWLGYGVKRLAGRHARPALAVLFSSLSVLFAANTNGALYPSDVDTEGPGLDPALTERSNAYRRVLALQLEAVRALEELPRGVPVYYGHFEHYLFRYPNLGYARGPLANGHNFSVEPLAPLLSGDFPDCVYALYAYPWLGGEKLRGLIGLPGIRPDLSAEVVREFRDGRYVMRLVRIWNRGADCSP